MGDGGKQRFPIALAFEPGCLNHGLVGKPRPVEGNGGLIQNSRQGTLGIEIQSFR
ncbi:hypothetical protein D3C87_2163380 [compost metagenome]